MSDLNVVALSGRLTQNPQLRETNSGHSVCELSIAVNRRQKDEVDFVDVTLWGKTAETAAEHLTKGRFITVTGRLKLERWETDEGQKRSKLSVVGDTFNFGPDSNSKKSSRPDTSETESEVKTEDAGAETVPF